ncbi:MAG: glutathione S-transferase [Paracoccaceae bacterium]
MTPVFYSFRRCPYAMRARLALLSSGVGVDLREIVLRDKPVAFLEASDSATVPCLVHADGTIDESLDIMKWSLSQNDPDGWLDMPPEGWDWITRADGPFKEALDRTKYQTRYPDSNAVAQREFAAAFLRDLDTQIHAWMFDRPSIADFAILPFVRQFAFIDKNWFDAQSWSNLQAWLDNFLGSARFEAIMLKYSKWKPGESSIQFPTRL